MLREILTRATESEYTALIVAAIIVSALGALALAAALGRPDPRCPYTFTLSSRRLSQRNVAARQRVDRLTNREFICLPRVPNQKVDVLTYGALMGLDVAGCGNSIDEAKCNSVTLPVKFSTKPVNACFVAAFLGGSNAPKAQAGAFPSNCCTLNIDQFTVPSDAKQSQGVVTKQIASWLQSCGYSALESEMRMQTPFSS